LPHSSSIEKSPFVLRKGQNWHESVGAGVGSGVGSGVGAGVGSAQSSHWLFVSSKHAQSHWLTLQVSPGLPAQNDAVHSAEESGRSH